MSGAMALDAGAEAETRPAGRMGIILLCCLVAVLEGFDLQVIGVAAPLISKDLGLGPEQVGFAFSASLVGLAIGALAGGWLADRLGRKPLLLIAVALFGVFTVGTAFATNLEALIVLRFLTGLGLGGSMPNIIAIVAETVRRERATFAVSAMAAGLSLGGVIVAQLARVLPPGTGWHILFVVGGVLPLLLLPVLWWRLPETRKVQPASAAPRTGILNALFGDRQAGATIALWIVFSLTLLQLSMLLNWLPSLVIAKGFAREQGFMAATVFNLGGIAGSLIIGALCDRFGARGPMLAIFALMAVSFWALAGAGTLALLLWAAFAAGFMVLGAQFALYGLSPRIYPDATRGTGVGAAVAVGRIGAIAGPILAGQLLGAGATADQLMLWMIPLVLVAGVAMAALARAAGSRLARPA